MKFLVLSDVHYPFTDKKLLVEIMRKEKPDKLILLGDIIEEKNAADEFFGLIPPALRKETYFVRGDDDKVRGEYSVLRLKNGGRKFVFMHGHQLNVKSDDVTKLIARFFKLFGNDLPMLAFAKLARRKLHLTDEYVVLGHSHGLKRFDSIRAVCAGTLSNLYGVYNDRGYVVIDDGKITLKRVRL